MKQCYSIILILLTLTSCQKAKELNGYEINGFVKNIPDSTLVQILVGNKVFDSTIVIGEKFRFIGEVEKPTNVFLMTKKSGDINFKPFWLENKKIDFYAEKGNFIEGKITGSKTQKEADLLNRETLPLNKAMDSLGKILSNKNLNKSYLDSVSIKFNEVRQKEFEVNKTFIRKHPNSLVSCHLLNLYKTTWGTTTTEKLFSLMNNEAQESDYGKTINHYLNLNKNLKIGDKYLDFEQENITGQKVKFSNIKKNILLLNFGHLGVFPVENLILI